MSGGGDPDAGLPALRASDADRERCADLLRRAGGDGRLTMEELDERLLVVYAARTRAELAALTADLGVEPEEAGAHGVAVRPGEGGARWLIAVLGGCERRGRWRIGRRCTVVNVMGGSDLDLNDAEFAGEEVEMTVFSLMGGSEIHVPEGLNVEVTEFALMGGNEVHLGTARSVPGAPLLRLRLTSIMGGVEVRRGPKRSRRERRLERHAGH